MSDKFGVLGRLNKADKGISKQENEEISKTTNKQKDPLTPDPNLRKTEREYEPFGTHLRPDTRRRLKRYAAETETKLQEVVDAALDEYLKARGV
jgi:hypothetical protein